LKADRHSSVQPRGSRHGTFDGTAGERTNAVKKYNVATEMDAPGESGNFNAGYVASAIQAQRYANSKGYGEPQ
jgi:hypothetical protein